jgi:hypothetical protein
MNTPSGKVETFLEKYQKLDSDVYKELDLILKKEKSMNDEEKDEYKKILIRQYQNLAYKIKNEEIDDNIGIVDVEIEVLNYKMVINNCNDYYIEHEDEFNNSINSREFIEYKLKQLRGVSDKIKYDLTFQLNMKNGVWLISGFSESDREKIHGLY